MFLLYIILALTLIISIPIAIFYLLTLQNTLKAVSPPNRAMPPGQVWLLLIPFFATIWNFIVVTKISKSIEQEFISRGIAIKRQPTFALGLVMCISQCVWPLQTLMMRPAPVLALIGLVGLITFIIYWAKVNEYKKMMWRLPPINREDSLIFSNLPQ